MQEDFIHYIWKLKKFDFGNSRTTSGLPVCIIDSGTVNLHSGPDFFNAKIRIGDQVWAGNVEIHIKASDWYVHRHEKDPAYENVILHVVWQDDMEVFRSDNSSIPTLDISRLVGENALQNYENLLLSGKEDKWINCEKDFKGFSDFDINNRLEPLYFERLQLKSEAILDLLKFSGNNWEAVLFYMLAKNFGLNVNGDAFLRMGQSFDFNILLKIRNSQERLESLLFGQSLLLEEDMEEPYYKKLKESYFFLKRKYTLDNSAGFRPKFFRLRPDNFPSIRLSQLAGLYHKNEHLFSGVIKAGSKSELYELLRVGTGPYWQKHYTFTKSHPPKSKTLTDNFMDLLMINTIIPLKFCYIKQTGTGDAEMLPAFLEGIREEKNSIIEKFNKLRPGTAVNVLQSQGLIQRKKYYCDKKAC
jgi:hypothetical protein